jgi:hypothetical protein
MHPKGQQPIHQAVRYIFMANILNVRDIKTESRVGFSDRVFLKSYHNFTQVKNNHTKVRIDIDQRHIIHAPNNKRTNKRDLITTKK